STEGLLDVDDAGEMRGWSFRLADRIARIQGRLHYANLAARGATTREIVTHQLGRAIVMRPDLATIFSGTNDVLRRRFDVREFAADVLRIHEALRGAGATVLTFTLPDLTPLLPIARAISPRIRAMNDVVRGACAKSGVRLLDFAELPLATDPRLWNEDRIHANPAGHERIADALAEALALPGADGRWREPLPEVRAPGIATLAWREIRWSARHLLPWTLAAMFARRARAFAGRRPNLEPLR
ncbi:MAG TPA: SGNH/GDSL hydrolase family protein, partial [Methylomirabilota bacterium]|nr:SGNH/GDSL hydrolase family protein [Methylomirabilota bacterium]